MAQLLAASKSRAPDYLDIPLTVVSILKGSPGEGDVLLKVYPEDRSYAPTTAAVLTARNGERLFFLTEVDGGPVGLYFAGSTADALQASKSRVVEAVKREVARQEWILRNWKPDKTLPHYEDVAQLLSELAAITKTGARGTEAERSAQRHIFQRLEALGEPAVPAIIAQMDDRRALAFREISLLNKNPDAWEGIRHYGPRLVVDALDAVLSQITGESFGQIYNGGSDRERRAAVDAWRIFAASRNCAGPPA